MILKGKSVTCTKLIMVEGKNCTMHEKELVTFNDGDEVPELFRYQVIELGGKLVNDPFVKTPVVDDVVVEKEVLLKPEIVEEPVEVKKVSESFTFESLKKLKRNEQVTMLVDLGVGKKDIPKFEKGRVDLLLKLLNGVK